MFNVLGTVHLEAINGEHWEIDVELQAKAVQELNSNYWQSSTRFTIFFVLFSVWFATSIVSRKSTKKERCRTIRSVCRGIFTWRPTLNPQSNSIHPLLKIAQTHCLCTPARRTLKQTPSHVVADSERG